jgi:hypothetical protein
LGDLPVAVSLDDDIAVTVPPKVKGSDEWWKKMRRLLKRISRSGFKSLSQVHFLNVTVCRLLKLCLTKGGKFSIASEFAGAQRIPADDIPRVGFQRREMQTEMTVCKYLTELLSLDTRFLAREKVDFASLKPLADSICPGLTFDPDDLTSQTSVIDRLLAFLETVHVPFTLSAEKQEELLSKYTLDAKPPPKTVNMISLDQSIRFLESYFNLFSGKVEDFEGWVGALWLFCDFFAAPSNPLHGIRFHVECLKQRVRFLIANPDSFPAQAQRVARALNEAGNIIGNLAAVERRLRVPDKYTQITTSLESLSKFFSESPLHEVSRIITTIRQSTILRLRLYVGIPELENFMVCCHNLRFLESAELPRGLQLLFNSLLPTFPNSPDLRSAARALMRDGLQP